MQELAPERAAIKAALKAWPVDTWLFEDDAGAGPQSIQQTYLREVEEADLYIGIFWRSYGARTIEEYEHARKKRKDCLIYEKRAGPEDGREPALQDFLDRVGHVETGHTIKRFDTPEELAAHVKDDVAAWLARIPRPLPSEEGRIMLEKVKRDWIEGVLEPSLQDAALLNLNKESVPEAVEHPWKQVQELPRQTSRALPADKRIDDLFDEAGRSLLILGEPGSGKTITLLELARRLIARAEQDAGQPVPVIFHLSTWTEKHRSIYSWLVEEFKTKYQVSGRKSRSWLKKRRLALLLDGLDEVGPDSRAACVEAINEFIEQFDPPGLALCSRLEEYRTLPVRLKLRDAICLQALTPDQVEDYLAGSTGPGWVALRAALQSDRALRALAQTPLMLHIMSMVYQDPSVADALINGEYSVEEAYDVEARRRQLFDTYITHMFEREGQTADSLYPKGFEYADDQFITYPTEPPEEEEDKEPRGGTNKYSRVETKKWLSWLAQQMDRHARPIFLIEQLQPSWLATRKQRWMYLLGSRLAGGFMLGLTLGLTLGLILGVGGGPMTVVNDLISGALFGLLFGLAGGFVAGVIDAFRFEQSGKPGEVEAAPVSRQVMRTLWHIVIDTAIYVLVLSLIGSLLIYLIVGQQGKLYIGLMAGSIVGLAFALLFGLKNRNRDMGDDIQTVEALHWSWADAQRSGVRGVIVGVVMGVGFGFLSGLFLEAGDLMLGLRLGLLVVLTGALAGGLLFAIFGGLSSSKIKRKTSPNQGIKLSIRNAAWGGLRVGLVFWIMLGLVLWPNQGLIGGLLKGLIGGLFFGLLASMYYGGLNVVQHYTLRLMLYCLGYTPRNYVQFLNWATRLIFMRRVGGGYIFIHRLMLEHFAALDEHQEHAAVLRQEA